MARILTNEFGRYAFREIAAGTSPAALEQFKLERLLELRAVIDTLRTDHQPGDFHDVVSDPRSRQ
jgi:hypothetical protein